MMAPTQKSWDYIVVGAGSAGGVLASRLSEDSSVSVLLIEAGGWDRSPYIHIPGLLYEAIGSRKFNWCYQGSGDPTLEGRTLQWSAGRVIGGSSSINGMVFTRGLPCDFDNWAASGHSGWGWADLLPYFRKSERWFGPQHESRGTDGPIAVRSFLEPNPACLAVINGFVATGTPYVADYNAGIDHGVGLTQTNQRRGLRLGVAGAYIRPARSRKNLTIMTGVAVTRLLLEKGNCIGVEAMHGGRPVQFHARQDVVLSAGAIASPAILLRSGIGDPRALEEMGIPVAHALPGVGANMNEHVNAMVSSRVTVRTYDNMRSGVRRALAGVQWLRDREGPASTPANHLQAFVKTDPALKYADIQVQTVAVGSFEPKSNGVSGVTSVVSLCRPLARGRVRLNPADPMARPLIETALLSCEADRRTLVAGLKRVRDILRAGPGATFDQDEILPGAGVQSDDEWLAYIRQSGGLNLHPTSTCRMGSGADDVVDARLRVHGVGGLRIADASIMPTVTSGNTNAVAIMIGEKAADLVRGN